MITNRKELIRSGTCIKVRKLALGSLEAALLAADPKRSVKEHVMLNDNALQIKNRQYPFTFDHVYVIGAGKASGYMAEALSEVLSDKITTGLVIIPDNFKVKLRTGNINLWRGTHPIPSDKGVKGTKKILSIVKNATAKDLVICLFSGGGSALMPLPFKGITISQKKKITNDLLRSGATIAEINAVRKHISALKGGRLAESVSKSTLASLIISDVVGDKLDTIASGPTVPDSTTFANASEVLKKYSLWNSLDRSIKSVIEDGLLGSIPETPKPGSKVFKSVGNFIIGSNELACKAALGYLESKGVRSTLLTTLMQGEAREVGVVASSIAQQINSRSARLATPTSVIMGGETTVTVKGNGRGGRNQELVLSALRSIGSLKNTAIASIGTDGIDGNSDAAGAIADTATSGRARQKKMLPTEYLVNNDSNTFFKKLNDVIKTGPTGTNVNDVVVVVCA
ncbi:MAG: glycerate kinase [Nitrososphaerales archaeon]